MATIDITNESLAWLFWLNSPQQSRAAVAVAAWSLAAAAVARRRAGGEARLIGQHERPLAEGLSGAELLEGLLSHS